MSPQELELKNRRAQIFQPLFLMEGSQVQRLAIKLWETIYPKGEEKEFDGFHCPGCGCDVKDERDLCGECAMAKAEYLEER